MSFWKSEDYRIVGKLIHDTNSDLSMTKTYIKHLKEENYKVWGKDELFEKLTNRLKNIEESIDLSYTRFKEKYEKQ